MFEGCAKWKKGQLHANPCFLERMVLEDHLYRDYLAIGEDVFKIVSGMVTALGAHGAVKALESVAI
jgi:hypothetical protein